MNGGDLLGIIEKENVLDEVNARSICYSLVSAVTHLHSHSIAMLVHVHLKIHSFSVITQHNYGHTEPLECCIHVTDIISCVLFLPLLSCKQRYQARKHPRLVLRR